MLIQDIEKTVRETPQEELRYAKDQRQLGAMRTMRHVRMTDFEHTKLVMTQKEKLVWKRDRLRKSVSPLGGMMRF